MQTVITQTLHALVINVDESIFRKEVHPRFRQAGVNNVIRVQAVKGNELDLLSLVHQGYLSPVALSILQKATPRNLFQDFPGINAVACFLSHCKVWQAVAEQYPQGALIFEEDAHVTPTNMNTVRSILTQLQRKHGHNLCAFHFGFLRFKEPVDETKVEPLDGSGRERARVVQHTRDFSGLQGYYLSQNTARRLLPHIFPMQIQVDVQLSRLYHAKVLPEQGKVFFTYPTSLVKQLHHQSSLQNNKCPRCLANLVPERYLKWILCSVIGTVLLCAWFYYAFRKCEQTCKPPT